MKVYLSSVGVATVMGTWHPIVTFHVRGRYGLRGSNREVWERNNREQSINQAKRRNWGIR
jgi:hypothetical protein